VDAALAVGTEESRQRALAIGSRTAGMGAAVLVDLAGRFLAFGERGQSSELVAELRRRSTGDLDERRRQSRELVERRLEQLPTSVPAGSVPVAVMAYRTPDHALVSDNIGDHIQSLAMVGNLVRLGDVTFSGSDGLGALAAELQRRVRPDLREPGVSGSIHLLAVDRDFSSANDVPERTWMIAFGSHMQPLYDLRYDFPYHPNIRPLFISFHVSRLEMLGAEARDYLRRYGPVGCRDWSTVFLLLSAGIDAFFTGCMSSTLDALFPARRTAGQGKGVVGLIDVPRRRAGHARKVRLYSQQSDAYRGLPPTDGLRAASDVLAAYQRDLDRAITGRLQAYLPLTALGVPVEFTPRSPGDVRFAGLTGLRPDDEKLAMMRHSIRDLIATAFRTVLAGAGDDEVYDLWRDLTRERVAEARARFQAPLADTPTSIDVAAAIRSSHEASRRFGPHETVVRDTVTDVVIAFDQNLTYPAAVLLESIVANASGPLRLWVLGRGLTDAYQEWLAGAFTDVPMTFLPCDRISYEVAGPRRRIPKRITVSTMDRLLLPGMLDGVDRVVYLDVDTLMLDDVCRLTATDLRGCPIAARDSNVSEASEWQRAGRQLDEAAATELRRAMGAHHGYGHAALNAGVLVLDLDRMRRDQFTDRFLGLGERFGLHDQDTMLAYVGPDRVALDPRWNAMPVLEDVADPRLIHWASFAKPWDRPLTFAQDRWREYAARLQERAGTPPPADGGARAG
jgi:lipopolysaccharide biosynthesis glycosyltransferase